MVPFWLKPLSNLWLAFTYDVYQGFTYIHHTVHPSPVST